VRTLREVLASLAHLAETRADDVALTDGHTQLTYARLAGRVAHLAHSLIDAPQTIAIFAPNSADWVVADLALALAGKTMVPLPTFFSAEQLTHIMSNAGVELVLTTHATETFDVPTQVLTDSSDTAAWPDDLSAADEASRIIYTSGTTGAPKGVVIGARQIGASARGLVAASGASASDRYLSVLPFSLLLEQIAAICVPLLAGAPVTINATAAGAALRNDPFPLVEAFATVRPTSSVLVPGLLEAWVHGLGVSGLRAPDCLRFIAVGGAPVSSVVSDAAWALGIPVHEGYGLSECCSVVSVNRPGARVPGTAGVPLDGLAVTIEDGEIVISGPTVMCGYLRRENLTSQVWHTGDMGEITPEGAVRVLGRKDNLIVTQNGRNISPEWVESLAFTAHGVAAAKLSLNAEQELVLSVTPRPGHSGPNLTEAVRASLSTAPDYAQPAHIEVRTGT